MKQKVDRAASRRATKNARRKARKQVKKTPRKQVATPPEGAGTNGCFGLYRTSFGIVTTDEDPTKFQLRKLAGAKLLRPSVRTEVDVRAEAEARLREAAEPGEYADRSRINEILQAHFAFFDGEIDRAMSGLASRSMMDLVLHLYDESAKLDDAAKAGGLDSEDMVYWSQFGHVYRRALKYLAERSTLAEPEEQPTATDEDVLPLTERALCVAEEAVQLAAMSDQTFGLFPERSTLTVAPAGELDYVSLDVAPPDGSEFVGRVGRDLALRGKYLPLDYPLFDSEMRDRLLGPAFETSFGLRYADCMGLLAALVDGTMPPEGGFPIPFALRQQFVAHLTGSAGLSREAADRLLDGFTVSPEKMRNEGRVLYKPKQEHRAYRRGFFAFPHPTGLHLAFSKRMARECLLFLARDLAFKHLPPEWEDPTLRAAVDKLSNACGTAFERRCHELLKERGFTICGSFKGRIGTGVSRLAIPPQVGEIDCLAYSPSLRMLAVLECKLVMPKTDPVHFRDDVSKFTGGDKPDKGYFAQHRRKCEWVRQNVGAVSAALASLPGATADVAPTRVGSALVTLYPTFASHEPDAPTCVSIGEFLGDFDEAEGWPGGYDTVAVWVGAARYSDAEDTAPTQTPLLKRQASSRSSSSAGLFE